MLDVLAMLTNEQAARAAAREANRGRFPFAAEMLDALEKGGITAQVVYAENAAGERVGKRDAGPWATYRPQGMSA
jgi:hypothetical protein